MRKGIFREGISMAVMRFFIGILGLLIVLSLGYFFIIRGDFSDAVTDPDIVLRSYVVPEITPEPSFDIAAAQPSATPTEIPDATLPPYATPTPTVTAEPTVSATPEPTQVAKYLVQNYTPVDVKSIPDVADTINGGISKCYVSSADGYKIMEIEGWAYNDVAGYNAAEATCYLIVCRDSANQYVYYQVTNRDGVSGVAHAAQNAQNVGMSDFRVYVDTSGYADDEYTLGFVLEYKIDGNAQYASYRLDSTYKFKVLNGEIISPIPTTAQ